MLGRTITFAIAIAITAVIVFHNFNSKFDHDETEHLHATWLVDQGEKPFTDFLEQHHPTIWYAFIPLVRIFDGEPALLIGAVRTIQMMCLILTLLFACLIGRNIYPDSGWRWTALLLVSTFMFTRNMLEVRPDPWMNVFIFAGIYLLIRFLESGSKATAFSAGVVFGMAIAILQKAVIVFGLAGFALVLLMFINFRQKKRLKDLFAGACLMLAGAAVPLALFAYLVNLGMDFGDFYYWNYTFNRKFYLLADLGDHFSFMRTLFRSFQQTPVIWIAGIAGISLASVKMFRSRYSWGPAHDKAFVLIFTAVGYLAFFMKNRFPNAQYLIVLFPILAVFLGEIAALAGRGKARTALQLGICLMTVEFLTISLFYSSNAGQKLIFDRLLGSTSADETIYAAPPENPIYRKDSAYFWYSAKLIGGAAAKMDDAETRKAIEIEGRRWKEKPAKLVYFDAKDGKLAPWRWGMLEDMYENANPAGPFVLRQRDERAP